MPRRRQQLELKRCENCGREFQPWRRWQRYCSYACGQHAAYLRRLAILRAHRDTKPAKENER